MNDRRPSSSEYAPFYAGYVARVEGDDVVATLRANKTQTLEFLKSIVWEKWELSYEPGKWTLAEVLIHLIDAERIFACRALRIARGDQTPMPGFEQDDYVPRSGARQRTPASIAEEFAAVRESTLHLFQNFTPEMWRLTGTANGQTVSARALAYIIAGHELHHLAVVRERYLGAD